MAPEDLDAETFLNAIGATTACAGCGYTPLRIMEGRYFLVAAIEPDETGSVPPYGSLDDPEGIALEVLACVRCGCVRLHGLGFLEPTEPA